MVGKGHITTILRGQGISLLSLPWPNKITIVIEEQGVDYYYGGPRNVIFVTIIVINVDGQGVFPVWTAKSTMMFVDGQWFFSLLVFVLLLWTDSSSLSLWMSNEYYQYHG